jgi:hypothetical protein
LIGDEPKEDPAIYVAVWLLRLATISESRSESSETSERRRSARRCLTDTEGKLVTERYYYAENSTSVVSSTEAA